VGAATASLVHNISGEEPLYLEKTVVSDEALSESGRDKFLALAGERGQELLFELDTFLTRLAATERSDLGRKYGVGIYFFEEQAAGQQAAQEQQSRKTYETDSGKATAIQEIDVLAGFGRKE
jgi:hypothetical protein